MGESTAIAWTDHTFNPWVGCARVSPGCEHCYAEALAKRTGMVEWGKNADRRVTSPANWAKPVRWNATARIMGRQALVFCASLADVFEDRPELVEPRERLWDLIESTPWLIWQLLTKRPENVAMLAPWETGWPPNIWLGTTVEDQQRADERIPFLLENDAQVRFLSCEPLIGPLDLSRWLNLEWMDALRPTGAPLSFRGEGGWGLEMVSTMAGASSEIDWVICGGESGPGHRPLVVDHARDLRDQCAAADVPFFFKQHGGARSTSGGDRLDGELLKAMPEGVTRG